MSYAHPQKRNGVQLFSNPISKTKQMDQIVEEV